MQVFLGLLGLAFVEMFSKYVVCTVANESKSSDSITFVKPMQVRNIVFLLVLNF